MGRRATRFKPTHPTAKTLAFPIVNPGPISFSLPRHATRDAVSAGKELICETAMPLAHFLRATAPYSLVRIDSWAVAVSESYDPWLTTNYSARSSVLFGIIRTCLCRGGHRPRLVGQADGRRIVCRHRSPHSLTGGRFKPLHIRVDFVPFHHFVA